MEKLQELYYNPRTGFISAEKMYLKLDKQVPLKLIKNFLLKQETYQIMKSKQNKVHYKPIIAYSTNNIWQIDLLDLTKYSRCNLGHKFLFCAVDVFSRKAFVTAIRSKSDTSTAIQAIFTKEFPILIQSDNGTEFLNKKF